MRVAFFDTKPHDIASFDEPFKKAGIEKLDMEGKFVAIKIHFGELVWNLCLLQDGLISCDYILPTKKV